MNGRQAGDAIVRQAWRKVDQAAVLLREADKEYLGEDSSLALRSRNAAATLEAFQIEVLEQRLGVEIPSTEGVEI
jgi:hypothetical protein